MQTLDKLELVVAGNNNSGYNHLSATIPSPQHLSASTHYLSRLVPSVCQGHRGCHGSQLQGLSPSAALGKGRGGGMWLLLCAGNGMVGSVTAPLQQAWDGWGLEFLTGGRKMTPGVGVCCLVGCPQCPAPGQCCDSPRHSKSLWHGDPGYSAAPVLGQHFCVCFMVRRWVLRSPADVSDRRMAVSGFELRFQVFLCDCPTHPWGHSVTGDQQQCLQEGSALLFVFFFFVWSGVFGWFSFFFGFDSCGIGKEIILFSSWAVTPCSRWRRW